MAVETDIIIDIVTKITTNKRLVTQIMLFPEFQQLTKFYRIFYLKQFHETLSTRMN